MSISAAFAILIYFGSFLLLTAALSAIGIACWRRWLRFVGPYGLTGAAVEAMIRLFIHRPKVGGMIFLGFGFFMLEFSYSELHEAGFLVGGLTLGSMSVFRAFDYVIIFLFSPFLMMFGLYFVLKGAEGFPSLRKFRGMKEAAGTPFEPLIDVASNSSKVFEAPRTKE